MTDVQALERYARSGDPDAFRHLVTCYQRLVYAACARRLREPHDIEDAVQETFLKLAQHAGRIKTSVSGWLYTAATRVCLDRLRRDQTRRRHELAWRPAEGDENAEHYGQLLAAVDDALAEMPDDQRDLLVQYFLEGRKQTQIAAEQGVTQSAVARRVERAVKQLREMLGKRGVAAPVAAVGSFLAADAAHAQVPTALTAALTKLGLSGTGVAATGATGSAGGLGSLLGGKTLAALGGAAAVAAVVTLKVAVTPDATPPSAGVAGAANVVPLAATGDAELDGKWAGRMAFAPDVAFTIRFDGDRVAFAQNDPPLSFTGTLSRLDAAAQPPEMDVEITASTNDWMAGLSYRAIYRVTDDGTLQIVTRDPDRNPVRPAGFDEAGEDGVMMLEARREAARAAGAQPADPELVGKDYGLPMVPVDYPETLALVREMQLTEAQIAIAPLTAIMGLYQTVQQIRIEPTGNAYTMFSDPVTGEDGVERYPFTFAVPVAWEEDVPAPYAIKTLPAFKGVAYGLTGKVADLDAAWTQVFEQAVHDGHTITGRGRMDTQHWVGPASDQNRFLLQVEIVTEE